VPTVQITTTEFDKDVPDIGELPNTDDDEFSFIINPDGKHDYVSKLESEQDELLSKLANLIQEDASRKTNLSGGGDGTLSTSSSPLVINQRIVQLRQELEVTKKEMSSNANSEAKLKALNEEHEKYLGQVDTLNSQVNEANKRYNALKGNLQVELDKFKSLTEMKAQVEELEVKLRKADKDIGSLANPDSVSILVSMGYSESRAQKAVLFTHREGGDVGRAVDWLESHQNDHEIDSPLMFHAT